VVSEQKDFAQRHRVSRRKKYEKNFSHKAHEGTKKKCKTRMTSHRARRGTEKREKRMSLKYR
jgi:hypothetical protein